MDGFSDIESGSSDVGSEVNEVETPDADFGDGDGVNDFDDTYESMNSGDETLEYSQETPENSEPVENSNENTDTAVDEQLNDFDDIDESAEANETSDVTPAGDNVEQTPSDMTTDENVDDALSDFEDDETGEADTESAKDETGETDSESAKDEMGEADTGDDADENAETDTDDAVDETDDADIESTKDETGESGNEDTTDESGETNTDTDDAADETGEADTEEAVDETDESGTDETADETDEADTEEAADEINESGTDGTADETGEENADVAGEADTDDTADETGETNIESTADETGETGTDDVANEVDETDTESMTDETGKSEKGDNTDESGGTHTDTKDAADETGEADTADKTGEADADDSVDETGEIDTDETVDETDETDTKDTAEESEGTDTADSEDTSNQPDVVNKTDLSPELKESLEKFNQEKWEQMSPEEQRMAITELRDSVANDLGLQNKPDVKFYNVQDETDFGGYSARENAIYINEYNMGDAHETADTIAHESRHCWQHERAENPQNEQDLAFRENFEDYVSPSDDYQEYKNQPVEVDARQYAADVCQNISEYSESFANDNGLEVSEGSTNTYSELSQEKGAVFDDRPDDLESKVEVLPISKKALEKCEDAGMSSDKVQEIREIPNGDKPNPDEYLSKDYIDNHLSKFEETGCYKIISDKRGEPTGTIGEEGIFVLNGSDVGKMIKDADGDPRKLEQALAMKPGYLGDNPYIIRCDEPHNLRMASGNEPNAWQDEWCPCGVTRDGTDEAVIDPMEKGEYSYKHVFGDDDWCK